MTVSGLISAALRYAVTCMDCGAAYGESTEQGSTGICAGCLSHRYPEEM